MGIQPRQGYCRSSCSADAVGRGMMDEWQPIETAPKLDYQTRRHICDIWAERYELVNTKTGETRVSGRRFADAVHVVDIPETAYSNAFLWSYRWEAAGLDRTWNITHWMRLPPPPKPTLPE